MGSAVADTHTLVWHFISSPKLSSAAQAGISLAGLTGDPVYVSSITIVELTYLVEKGKLPEIAYNRLSVALLDPGTVFDAWTLPQASSLR